MNALRQSNINVPRGYPSVSSMKEFFQQIKELLIKAQVPDAHRIASWIFCDVLNCTLASLILQEGTLEAKQVDKILKMANRCTSHEPVQYVIGSAEFCGMKLHLSPKVLIPRPETEQLVELALTSSKIDQRSRVLDIGTGSGCIALAVKQRLPDARVTACDVSSMALNIAKMNADLNGLSIQFMHADLFSKGFIQVIGTGYDLVISNPPYIPDNERQDLPRMVRDYEPKIALFCGDDPLRFYRGIIQNVDLGLLAQGGILAMEAHADHADSVGTMVENHLGLQVEVLKDFAGFYRFVVAKSDAVPTESGEH